MQVMAKSPTKRNRDARSQQSRTGRTPRTTSRKQRGEKKKDNKPRVAAEPNKLKKDAAQDASVSAILPTPYGRSYSVMDVAGHGTCAMLVVYALRMLANGVSYDEVSSVVYPKIGDISVELKDGVQRIRNAIADASDDELSHLGDGEESQSLEYVLKNASHEIETKDMFKAVALLEDGYLDPVAMRLAAGHLKLNGIRVVRLVDGVLEPCDKQGDLTDTDVNLALFDGKSHYMALVPTTPVSTDSVSWS